MTVELWQHKPTVNEMIRYTGGNADEIVAWAGDRAYVEFGRLVVRTRQGDFTMTIGDWVIRDVIKGRTQFYPCPDQNLTEKYDRVGEGP